MWHQPVAESETIMALGITSNSDLLRDSIQFSATREWWNLSVRRDGRKAHYVTVRNFSPPLSVDHDYTFEITIANTGEVIVQVPGGTETVEVGTKDLQGNHGYWELYADPQKLPARTVFGFDSVWAGEDGQPLSPIPAESTR